MNLFKRIKEALKVLSGGYTPHPLAKGLALPLYNKSVAINISNTSKEVKTAKIFARFFGTNSGLQQEEGVHINDMSGNTRDGISYHVLRSELITRKIRIAGLKMVVENSKQFCHNWTIEKKCHDGSGFYETFQPLSHRSPQNQINTQIDTFNFKRKWQENEYVDGRTIWHIPVNPGENITLIIFYKDDKELN